MFKKMSFLIIMNRLLYVNGLQYIILKKKKKKKKKKK